MEILGEAGLPYYPTGSLHAAYRADEAAVGTEFAARSGTLGYNCTWLTARKTLDRSCALNPEGLLGALWSPIELTVDPRLVISQLPGFLRERYGVAFHFNTAVQAH
jgi:glycine/D-amino acid oxidase-like deaminating enzyme